jgi:hypothetical protein
MITLGELMRTCTALIDDALSRSGMLAVDRNG